MPFESVIPAAPSPEQVRAALRGTYIAFVGSGFAFASWASRIPQIRAHLHLSPERLGLVLLFVAAGSVTALPLAGPVVHRLGAQRALKAMAALLTVGLGTVAVGYLVGATPVVVGLFLFGFANGAWDVAMNVQGALVERHVGRSIMARFHAGYSLGTVVGALTGVVMVALRAPVTAHLLVVAVGIGLIVSRGTRGFMHDATGAGEPIEKARQRGALAAWREPRTIMIGLFVLAFAFAEGTGNDWISLATIDGYRVPAAIGTLVYATFLSAMTFGRWFGPGLLDRHGHVPVIRVLAAIGIVGTLLLVFAPFVPLAFAGAALWGVGTSLGFPVGMSAGADEPQYAAGRVSVIASIGYCAFLAGPPSVGFLGQHIGVLRALTAVAVLLSIAMLMSSAVAPPQRQRGMGSARSRKALPEVGTD
jgi:MFS family permease